MLASLLTNAGGREEFTHEALQWLRVEGERTLSMQELKEKECPHGS